MAESLLGVHQGGGIGGAPVSLLHLFRRLDPEQFDGRVAFAEDGPIVERARELGVAADVVRTGGAFYYSAHARLAPRMLARFVRTYPGAVLSAQRLLRERKPAVLHLNTSVLLAWGAAARRESVPVLWMVREVLGPHPMVRRWHARYLERHARRTVAISEAVRSCFPDSTTIERVYNAVDLQQFDLGLLRERPRVRAELGLADDEQAVFVVGSVQREKGHWLLLDAFARVLETVPRARMVVVAGGVGEDYARSLRGRVKHALDLPLDNLDALLRDVRARGLADRVRVTGYRSDIPRLLAAADVLAFPSIRAEGFGRPIIEAMAMRRPVVATDVGPSRELLGDSAGVLVRPDPADLARGLLQVLRSPEASRRLGGDGRRRVEELFTLDRQVAEMSRLYREVAGVA